MTLAEALKRKGWRADTTIDANLLGGESYRHSSFPGVEIFLSYTTFTWTVLEGDIEKDASRFSQVLSNLGVWDLIQNGCDRRLRQCLGTIREV